MSVIVRVLRFVTRKILFVILYVPIWVFSYLYVNYLQYIYRTISGRYTLGLIKQRGVGCVFYGPLDIKNPDGLEIGDYVRIGEGSYLFCRGGLEIGSNTQISRNCTIYTANHDVSEDVIPYGASYVHKPVEIGNSVWIGMNVCITPGVKIGDGAIIGMGAVISKDVKAGEIVVGPSSRCVGARDMEKFTRLNDEESFFGKLY